MRNLIRAGVPRSIAMKISGHATESVFERYNIDTKKELGDALDAVSDYVAGLPASSTSGHCAAQCPSSVRDGAHASPSRLLYFDKK